MVPGILMLLWPFGALLDGGDGRAGGTFEEKYNTGA